MANQLHLLESSFLQCAIILYDQIYIIFFSLSTWRSVKDQNTCSNVEAAVWVHHRSKRSRIKGASNVSPFETHREISAKGRYWCFAVLLNVNGFKYRNFTTGFGLKREGDCISNIHNTSFICNIHSVRAYKF